MEFPRTLSEQYFAMAKMAKIGATFLHRVSLPAAVTVLLTVLTVNPVLQAGALGRHEQSPPYLLALGDSLAAGYQPQFGVNLPPADVATGYPDMGYPGSYAADLATRLHLRLIDLGCPGETTTSMTSHPALGQCAQLYEHEFGASNQEAAAQSFLERHAKDVALVTIDLGANDISKCAHTSGVAAFACFTTQAALIAKNLPRILEVLHSTLRHDDPHAEIVGMNYYDPFLGLAYRPGGITGKAEASASLLAVTSLNDSVDAIFNAHAVAVANVAAAFRTESVLPMRSFGGERLPEDVFQVCVWTHMCPDAAGAAADVHPNAAGYRAIAAVFASAAR
jgi:lysophospholipase L1-like esterase